MPPPLTGAPLVQDGSAEATASSRALMDEIRTQSKQTMANNLAMGRMSQMAAMSEALGKKFKAGGDSVKGLV
ncbi:hypothetical protein [Mitsuaria sp. GD03876]|uniref:hypothetical protein n=1 Tax=Mitsuaria sp. GD03876 TaxID=2975399 RepID=UPI00244B9799|nr:hypothetical protein [Mitsuaria sp. GD03876]MDH0868424.1 hypothetical protein [Mitsuaria sp. GD03876]